MAINVRLQRLLDLERSSYAVLPHDPADRALDVARTTHVPERQVAKVVVMRDADGADSMVVVPADEHVVPALLPRVTGRIGLRLEDEDELARLFPDCEVGAMPPFGALYGMPMYVDPCLLEGPDLFFQAGNHDELVLMRTEEYERIAWPFFASGCLHPDHVAAVG